MCAQHRLASHAEEMASRSDTGTSTRPPATVRWFLSFHHDDEEAHASAENEKEVGRAIRESGIPRSEIFITTKLCTLPLFHLFLIDAHVRLVEMGSTPMLRLRSTRRSPPLGASTSTCILCTGRRLTSAVRSCTR
jgi:hypothetical protein